MSFKEQIHLAMSKWQQSHVLKYYKIGYMPPMGLSRWASRRTFLCRVRIFPLLVDHSQLPRMGRRHLYIEWLCGQADVDILKEVAKQMSTNLDIKMRGHCLGFPELVMTWVG